MPDHEAPGPRDWMLGIPQVRKLREDLLGHYSYLARTYGDAVLLRPGFLHYYIFFHPEQIREVLVTKAKHFVKMPRSRQVLARLDGDGLLFAEGDAWLRQRRLVQPAFHARRLEGYGRSMVEQTQSLLKRWGGDGASKKDFTVDFDKAMTDLTLMIVSATLFGSDPGADPAELGAAVATMSDVFMDEVQSAFFLPDWLPTPGKARKRRAIRFLSETVDRIIRARRASGEDRNDLLSMLLLAVDEQGDGRGMSDHQARHEAMTLFLAGHDTTAAGLTWIGYVLATQPEVAGRAVREVESALDGRPPTLADVPCLGYLERVVKETLRLYPPAIGVFARKTTDDLEIGGYRVAKGSIVQLISYVTHRDARWFADPERFDPDRFAPGRVESIPQFAYFPFGGGPRACIGNQFAMTEMILVVATLLQNVRFELAPGQGPVGLSPKMSLRPAGGLPLRLTWVKRSAPEPAGQRG